MKKIFLSILFTFLSASYALALTTSLTWVANTEDDLAGYKLYVGNESGVYTEIIDIPVASLTPGAIPSYDHQVTVTCGNNKSVYYALTAYDSAVNESEKSVEVSKLHDPAPCAPKLNEIIAAITSLLQHAKLETTITFPGLLVPTP